MAHQIYFRIPISKPVTLGLELESTFGIDAASRLVNFLDFVTRSRTQTYSLDRTLQTKEHWQQFLVAFYSVDAQLGLYQLPKLLDSNCTYDPHLPNSDGGIALVDLTFALPKYCFLNINQMQGVERIALFIPADVETYLCACHGNLNSRSLSLEFRMHLVELIGRAQGYPLLSVEEARPFFPRHFTMNLRCSPKVPLLPVLSGDSLVRTWSDR